MKFKYNWGTGVLIVFAIMIIGMIVLVSVAVRQDFDLVDKDYYQKSVDYQSHIDKLKKSDELNEKVKLETTDDLIIISFPRIASNENYQGKIHFYSPVDAKNDKLFDLKIDTSFTQKFDKKDLKSGRYKVKIDWTASESQYYFEDEISISMN